MSQQKQILLIEELGTPKAQFEKNVKQSKLNYEIIWEESAATKERVEVLVMVKRKLDKDYLQQFPNLKMIAVAFTGYDAVDIDYCHQQGIAIYNVPSYSTNSVVELAIGLTIAVLRDIGIGNTLIRNQGWALKPGIELHGKTVGILGTGEIGIATAKVFKALGCKLIGWSRSENEAFKALGGEYISDKQALFAAADIVSVHLPLNKHTEGIVGKEELTAMKQTAILINTARGPIVNESDLINALEQKDIAGAGIDVYAQEPINHDNKLLQFNNVVLTPHVAFKTEEALIRRMEITVKNITDFNKGAKDNRVG
ncbi:MAG TPA: hydroxyacid dehydrogenase [Bacteroidales bacterium]|nr:hydroxyacid dehydrogenase [Bacteroidales bacterium]